MTTKKPDPHLIQQRANVITSETALHLNWGRAAHGDPNGGNTVNKIQLGEIFLTLMNAPAAEQDRLIASISAVLGINNNGGEKTAADLLVKLGSQSSPHALAL